LYGNNSVILDTINEYGLLANTLLQSQLNGADKYGLSSSMGFNLDNVYNVLGHKIYDTATSVNYLTFEYALPLISLIGSGCDKLFPIGNIYSLRLEFTMDSYSNFTVAATAGGSIGSCSISEIEFVGQMHNHNQLYNNKILI